VPFEDGRRRFLITVGAARYGKGSDFADLPSVEQDVKRIETVLGRYGYRHVLPEISLNAKAARIRIAVTGFCANDERREEDVIAFYFSGHGDEVHSGRHYLWPAGGKKSNPAGTAIATGELARWFFEGGGARAHNILILLDACYAGKGSGDIAAEMGVLRNQLSATEAGLIVLSAARPLDEAHQGVFIEALEHVLADEAFGGSNQLYIDPLSLVTPLNRWLAEKRQQRVQPDLFGFGGEQERPFLPNRRFWLDDDRLAHWDPRARGVEFITQPGDFFSGRERALQDLKAWLRARTTDHKIRVVTGDPGSGKSAVLGKLVTETFFDWRARTGAVEPPHEDAEPARLDVALYARKRTVAELSTRLGELARCRAGTPERLVKELKGRQELIRIVVDALDEAEDPEEIGRKLLRPLAELPSVRLVVGSRSPRVPGASGRRVPYLGDRQEIIDLDEDKYFSAQDLQDYVERRLRETVGSPYTERPNSARLVATAVANQAKHAFLIASLVSHQLARAIEPLDTTSIGWEARVPESVGDAFAADLSRFKEAEQKVRDLLLPLAFAEGRGIPQEEFWADVASAVAGRQYTNSDIRWLKREAGFYITPDVESGVSVYRLFHETLAECLRDEREAPFVHGCFVEALKNTVPLHEGVRRWDLARPYALRHLAAHQLKKGETAELYVLAREDAYHTAQLKSFPSEPDVALRAVDLSLRAALEASQASVAAEMLLLSAERSTRIMAGRSPLSILRVGTPSEAIALVELFDPARRTLWLLLICWELAEAGKIEEARSIVRRLASATAPSLKGWKGRVAALLLTEVLSLDPQAFGKLVHQVLVYRGPVDMDDGGTLGDLVVLLAKRRHFDAAEQAFRIYRRNDCEVLTELASEYGKAGRVDDVFRTVERIRTVQSKAKAYAEVAIALGDSGKPERLDVARKCVSRVQKLLPVKGPDPYDDKVWAFRAIAERAVNCPIWENTAETIDDLEERAWALSSIAALEYQAGGSPKLVLARARECAFQITERLPRVRALRRIASTLVPWDTEVSRRLLEKAATLQGKIDEDDLSGDRESNLEYGIEWSALAEARAKLGDMDEAEKLLDRIPPNIGRTDALKALVIVEAQHGHIQSAIDRVKRCQVDRNLARFPWVAAKEPELLFEVASAAVKLGQGSLARDIVETCLGTSRHDQIAAGQAFDEMLMDLARREASAGRVSEALTITAAIIGEFGRKYTRSEIAISCAQRGDRATARRLVSELADQTGVVTDPAFEAIAIAEARRDQLDAAKKTVESIRRRGERSRACIGVAAAHARRDGLAVGLSHLSGIDRHQTANGLGELLGRHTNEQELERIMAFARGLPEPRLVAVAYASIGRALIAMGKLESGRLLFAQAESETRMASKVAPEKDSITSNAASLPWLELAINQTRAGLISEGQESLKQATSHTRYEGAGAELKRRFVEGVAKHDDTYRVHETRDVSDLERGIVNSAFQIARLIDLPGEQMVALTAVANSGFPLPQDLSEYVFAWWQHMPGREGGVAWAAEILATAGDVKRLASVLQERERSVATAHRLSAALARLWTGQASTIARLVIDRCRSHEGLQSQVLT
jgi:tetratricopeptide (TPR) repeat protein